MKTLSPDTIALIEKKVMECYPVEDIVMVVTTTEEDQQGLRRECFKDGIITALLDPEILASVKEQSHPSSKEPTESGEDWWCPKCEAYLCGEQVTFEENHATCGTPVYVKSAREDTPKYYVVFNSEQEMKEWLRYEVNRKSGGVKEEKNTDWEKEAEELLHKHIADSIRIENKGEIWYDSALSAVKEAAQLHCNDGLDLLIESCKIMRDNVENSNRNIVINSILTKANEIKSLNK